MESHAQCSNVGKMLRMIEKVRGGINCKLVCIDIDGTLLNDAKEITVTSVSGIPLPPKRLSIIETVSATSAFVGLMHRISLQAQCQCFSRSLMMVR